MSAVDGETAVVPLRLHPLLRPLSVRADAALLATVAGTASPQPRRALQRGLERLQPIAIDRCAEAPGTCCEPDPAPADWPALCELMAVPTLPTDWRLPPARQAATAVRVTEAMALLRDTDVELYAAINVVVGRFLLAYLAKYEGGSRTSVVGVIWIGLDPAAPAADFAALIAHEFVHQCIFLDDMVRCIFPAGEPELAEPDALVVSALRKVPRGYDKAYHSAFVALTMEALYRAWDDRRAGTLLPATRLTIDGLLAKPKYVTPHGYAALERLAELAEGMHAA